MRSALSERHRMNITNSTSSFKAPLCEDDVMTESWFTTDRTQEDSVSESCWSTMPEDGRPRAAASEVSTSTVEGKVVKPLSLPTLPGVERKMDDLGSGDCRAFPTTGRPLLLKIMCSYTETTHPLTLASFEGYKITSDWKLEHLLQVTEMLTGIMRTSQRLYHAGQELPPDETIRGIVGIDEANMPDRFTVHVIVNEENFPQCFGPLRVAEVPLTGNEILLPKFMIGSFHWMMKPEVIERLGVRSPGDKQVTAQCSPFHRITFSGKERKEAQIPPEAVEFAWSYPVANWEEVEEDPHLLEDWALCREDILVVKDFLVMGGFIYLDKEQQIVKVTAAVSNRDTNGGMQFGRRQKWHPAWTKALIGDGCFHRVTCGRLKQAGAQYFCWLRPGETFDDDYGKPFERQPEVPHGGFAFLFHDIGAHTPEDLVVDCYFAIKGMSEQVSGPNRSSFTMDEDCPTELVGHTSAQLNHHNIATSALDS